MVEDDAERLRLHRHQRRNDLLPDEAARDGCAHPLGLAIGDHRGLLAPGRADGLLCSCDAHFCLRHVEQYDSASGGYFPQRVAELYDV